MKLQKMFVIGMLFGDYIYAGHMTFRPFENGQMEHELPPEGSLLHQEESEKVIQDQTRYQELQNKGEIIVLNPEMFAAIAERFLEHRKAIDDLLESNDVSKDEDFNKQLEALKATKNLMSAEAQARIKAITMNLAERCAQLNDSQIDALNFYLQSESVYSTSDGKKILAQLQQQMVQAHIDNNIQNAKMGLTVGFLAFNVISSFLGLACAKFAALAGGMGVLGKLALVGASVFHTHRALAQARGQQEFKSRPATKNAAGEQTFMTKASDFVVNSGNKIVHHVKSIARSMRDGVVGTQVDAGVTASAFNKDRRQSRANQARTGLERAEGMLSGAVDAVGKKTAQAVGSRTRVDQYNYLISDQAQQEQHNQEEPSAENQTNEQVAPEEQRTETKTVSRFASLDGATLHKDVFQAFEQLDIHFPELRTNQKYQGAFAELMNMKHPSGEEPSENALSIQDEKVQKYMKTVISEMAQEVHKLSYEEQDVLFSKMNIDLQTGPLGEINNIMRQEILTIDGAKNRAALKSFLIVTTFIGLCVANFFCPIIGPVMLVSVGIVVHSLILLALTLKAVENFNEDNSQNSTGKKIIHAYRKAATDLVADAQSMKQSVVDRVQAIKRTVTPASRVATAA